MLAFAFAQGKLRPGVAPTARVTEMNFDPGQPEALTSAQQASNEMRSYVNWGGRQLALGFVAVIVLVIVLSLLIVGPVVAAYGEDTPEAYFAAAIATLLWDVGFVVVAFSLVRGVGGTWQGLGFRNLKFRPLMIIAAYLVAAAAVQLYALSVTSAGLEFLEPDAQIPEGLFESSIAVAATGIAVVAGAPIAEEVLFRGFLFGGLRSKLPFWPAALLSGFIFSLAHADPGFILPFTAIGAILAYTYERSRTLVTPIGVHLLFNSVSFFALVFFPELREAT